MMRDQTLLTSTPTLTDVVYNAVKNEGLVDRDEDIPNLKCLFNERIWGFMSDIPNLRVSVEMYEDPRSVHNRALCSPYDLQKSDANCLSHSGIKDENPCPAPILNLGIPSSFVIFGECDFVHLCDENGLPGVLDVPVKLVRNGERICEKHRLAWMLIVPAEKNGYDTPGEWNIFPTSTNRMRQNDESIARRLKFDGSSKMIDDISRSFASFISDKHAINAEIIKNVHRRLDRMRQLTVQ
jgi:hypothetical protein